MYFVFKLKRCSRIFLGVSLSLLGVAESSFAGPSISAVLGPLGKIHLGKIGSVHLHKIHRPISYFSQIPASLTSVKRWHSYFPSVLPSQFVKELNDLAKEIEEMDSDRYLAATNFVTPNETNPAVARPVFESMPEGTSYLSVGTERGFTGAVLSRADHLFMVDMAKGANLFNKINVLLLKTAECRADYVHLRLVADPEEWIERFAKTEIRFGESAEIRRLFYFWKEQVRDFSGGGI